MQNTSIDCFMAPSLWDSHRAPGRMDVWMTIVDCHLVQKKAHYLVFILNPGGHDYFGHLFSRNPASRPATLHGAKNSLGGTWHLVKTTGGAHRGMEQSLVHRANVRGGGQDWRTAPAMASLTHSLESWGSAASRQATLASGGGLIAGVPTARNGAHKESQSHADANWRRGS